jgi:predicted permease
MRILKSIAGGLAALLHPRAADRDVTDEVQQFLDDATAAYERRGLSYRDAVRAATLDMGNATVTREQVRVAGWEHAVESLLADVRYALRRLRGAPAFTITAVATLALGIGASTTVFSVISPILIEPLPFPHADRIVTIDDRNGAGAAMPITLGSFAELQARTRSFETLAAADDWQPSLSGSGDPERLKGERVTSKYFDVYGVAPIAGRDFRGDDAQPGGAPLVIVSDRLLERRFGGDRSIVGRTIDLDGEPYTVAGVMPRGFDNIIDPAVELWAPLRDRVTGDLNGREWGHHYKAIGRLAPTANVAGAMREIQDIGRAPVRGFPRPAWANLQNGLLVRSMQDEATAPVRPSLLAIVGAVLLLLVVTAVNITNLLVARAAQRRAEIAMRVALGASRGRIVRQLLTESVVLALVGGASGFIVARFGVRALVAVSPPGLPRVDAIRLDARVFLFALALTTIVGVLVGLVPSFTAARAEAGDGLHQTTRRNARLRGVTRNGLVVAEVALAVVLLVEAGLLFRSVSRLMTVPPGFDQSNVVTMQVVAAGPAFRSDTARKQFFDRALDAVRHVPGVVNAAFTSQLPLSGDVDGYGIEAQSLANATAGSAGSALRYAVTPEYFATMGIALHTGRVLGAEDRGGAPEAIVINQSLAARLFPGKSAIGERIRFGPELGGDKWDYIVGVVNDVKHYTLAANAPDAFYVASGQWGWVDQVQTLVVRTSGDAAALAPSLERAVWSIDHNRPIQRVRTMQSFVTASAGNRRFVLTVIEAFAFAAFALAAVGLYGVIAAGVIERIREIGIRTALGAPPSTIVGAIVRRSVSRAVAGSIIGIAGALGATRKSQTMMLGVTRDEAVTESGDIANVVMMEG